MRHIVENLVHNNREMPPSHLKYLRIEVEYQEKFATDRLSVDFRKMYLEDSYRKLTPLLQAGLFASGDFDARKFASMKVDWQNPLKLVFEGTFQSVDRNIVPAMIRMIAFDNHTSDEVFALLSEDDPEEVQYKLDGRIKAIKTSWNATDDAKPVDKSILDFAAHSGLANGFVVEDFEDDEEIEFSEDAWEYESVNLKWNDERPFDLSDEDDDLINDINDLSFFREFSELESLNSWDMEASTDGESLHIEDYQGCMLGILEIARIVSNGNLSEIEFYYE